MIGRVDIEGSKSNVAMNTWLPQASVPPALSSREIFFVRLRLICWLLAKQKAKQWQSKAKAKGNPEEKIEGTAFYSKA